MSDARVLLFDLDGTLTDNFEGISRSIRYALARVASRDLDDAVLRDCIGPPLRRSFAKILRTADPALIESAIARYRERYADEGWRENTVYPGMAGVLAALAAKGYRMLICTSKPRPYAERIVAHFGLAAYFDAVYGPDLGGTLDDKSALMEALLIEEHLDPDHCTMIGDRAQDMVAARAHKVGALGVLWGYGTGEELRDAGAQVLATRPDELTVAIATLSRYSSL